MRDIYHHKSVRVSPSCHYFSQVMEDSKEKTNLYQMQFFDNRGMQGHPSKNTTNYFLPLRKTT